MPDEIQKPTEVTSGFIDRVVFENPDSGYAVLRLEAPAPEEFIFTAVGTLAGLNAGLYVELSGRWIMNKRFGEQFETDFYKITYPQSPEGISKYLSSGIIPGVGGVYAKRILEHFGEKALDIIESNPTRLYEVSGIGKKRAGSIAAALRKHSESRKLLVVLLQYGITPSKAQKIIRFYGEKAGEVLKTDPYRLAEDIRGIGFLSADKIAASVGIPPDSPERARAGLIHITQKASEHGHVYIPLDELMAGATELLQVEAPELEAGLKLAFLENKLVQDKKNAKDNPRVFLRRLYNATMKISKKIASLLLSRPVQKNDEKYIYLLRRFEKTNMILLTQKQKEAVLSALSQPVAVITGGPGTGKTTIVKAVVDLSNETGKTVKLAAPTGRAAKRLSETTEKPASTIHRLLEYNPHMNRYMRNEHAPIEADLVIIDEASMIDIELFAALAGALEAKTQLLLVGDIDQLPSVGPGRLLADMIDVDYVHTTRLDVIFRQKEGGSIVSNAHLIKEGKMPQTSENENGEFFFIGRQDPVSAADLVLEMATGRIPAKFGFDSFEDIQVLSPMRKGEAGVEKLNERLQEAMNPDGEVFTRGKRKFRIGDKVLQTVNDYGREVFNGDVGRISTIDKKENALLVDFGGRDVVYEREDLDGLALAYAMTIHKSQGSEYEAVVIPLLSAHFVLLRRDLIYTAVTRAKKLVVLIGQKKALSIAVSRKGGEYRNSVLTEKIKEKLTELGVK